MEDTDMGCTCSIEDDGGGDCEFYQANVVKARTGHRCGECGTAIVPGDHYESIRGKYDGDFWTGEVCLICRELRDAFFCSWMYGHVYEALWEEIDWNGGEVSSACILALSEPAREVVFEMIERAWKDIEDDD